jgi:Immunoglobulin I-set domain
LKIASLILAALLQLMPMGRIALTGAALASAGWAQLATWMAGAVALLGSCDAVSGASSGVSGLVKYSGTTPVGVPTFEVAEPMGQSFRYRISASNPGSDFARNYFNCTPLPPGLTINTNPGAAGYLSGIPLAPGTYHVTLLAGNLNYPIPATAQATIAIYLPNSPPAFAAEPQDVSVIVGSNATLRAEVIGTPPLTLQWWHDGVRVTNGTGPFLSLRNVQGVDAGRYQLTVSNNFGSVTSTVSRVTIREPLAIELRIVGGVSTQGTFQFEAIGPVQTSYIIWCSGDMAQWAPLTTNWVVDGLLRFSDPEFVTNSRRFYRVSTTP